MLVISLFTTMTISSRAEEVITRIDSGTFTNTAITVINIGSEVDEITDYAFRSLKSLKEIKVSEKNPFYCSYGGCLYDKQMTTLLCYPPALSGTVIPETVTGISMNALHGVPPKLKSQIKEVIEAQASSNLFEDDVPGAHFLHTPEGIRWRQEDGTVISPYSNIMNMAGSIVDSSSTAAMTQPQQLKAAFDLLSASITYERSSEVPTGDWVLDYASKTLGSKRGNCYGYAASFAYIAKGLGYDAKVCTGTVTSALGGRTAHAWNEVKIGNKWYVFDSEMQSAKGSGYYKVDYDNYPAGPLKKEASYTVSF